MINKKKSKNYDIFNNNNNNNKIQIFNKKQLYRKPINMKERGNIIKDKYNTDQIILNNDKDNVFKTNIELRRERLEEMKKKIDEINKDIKNTEKYFHKAKNEISKNQDEYILYNNNINYNSEKIVSNKKTIFSNDENNNINNINNINIDNDIKSYQNQIIDTDINRNEKNYNYNSNNKKNSNLFNSKINQFNMNIYRNHNNKMSNIFQLKSDNSNLNNKYSQRIERKFIHQTQNLKKLKNRNIFKNFKSNFTNKSNRKMDNTSEACNQFEQYY